jgi:WD40 repeat protein
MEFRSATSFSGGHSDDVDYVSWNPTHPELFCTSSQKDRRIVFWDARRERRLLHPYAGSSNFCVPWRAVISNSAHSKCLRFKRVIRRHEGVVAINREKTCSYF